MPQTPPPLPPERPPTLGYQQPRRNPPRSFVLDTGGADGFTGINLRWKDNAFQLFAGVVGALLGGMCGLEFATHSILFTDPVPGAFLGAVAGVACGVVASGLFIGLHRFARRKPRYRDDEPR